MNTTNIDNNKLIAVFMGWKPSVENHHGINLYYLPNDETGDYNYKCKQMSINEMNYNNSWDCIMPVVEKIETHTIKLQEKYRRGFLKNSTHADVTIDTMYDSREEFKGWSSRAGFEGGAEIYDSTRGGEDIIRYSTKIEAIYLAVVEFIKWYNENRLTDEQPN